LKDTPSDPLENLTKKADTASQNDFKNTNEEQTDQSDKVKEH
jgi:hypothetical protein